MCKFSQKKRKEKKKVNEKEKIKKKETMMKYNEEKKKLRQIHNSDTMIEFVV